jgi:23S rRNA (guanosine2251-2'-O)-methyltransferase
MAFHIQFHEVSNLSNFLIKLHQQGYIRAGLDASQADCLPIYRWKPESPLALVVGSESEGIGHAVSKRLDYRLKIPMSESVDSLNASQAATIAMSWVASETKA